MACYRSWFLLVPAPVFVGCSSFYWKVACHLLCSICLCWAACWSLLARLLCFAFGSFGVRVLIWILVVLCCWLG
jgi:hypothetical protein